jgi:tetratricopeptide (TPR) repeat protein
LAVFLTTRGHALHDMGNLSEAQKTYEKALVLSPKNIPARTWLTRTIKRARIGSGLRKPASAISRAGRRQTNKTSSRRPEIPQRDLWPRPRRASTKSSK